MCIIVYKPTGIESPSWATLHQCFDYNNDGAGFMYAENGKVYIQKGYMTWNSFKKAFKPFKNRVDLPLVLHFRITTHGGTEKGLCHPFPLTSNVTELKATKSVTDIGIAHNGFISMTSYASKGASDTSEFIRKYASCIIASPQWYRNPNANKVLAEVIGSRMLVLSNDGHGEVVGDGWVEEDGVMFSNTSYKEYAWWTSYKTTTKVTGVKGTKCYDDDDDTVTDNYTSFDDGCISNLKLTSDKGWDLDTGMPTYCKYWFDDDGKDAKEPNLACMGCVDYRYCWE